MATDTKPGSPIWIDLTTPDPDAARDFYSALFGWTYVDSGPEFGNYNNIFSEGSPVGGLMKAMTPDGTPIEGPAHWDIYLKSDDIAATTERIRANGGTVVFDSMPVGDLGSMAIYTDPSGATIGAWQAGEFHGFELPLRPGTPVWFESMSTSYDACLDFYRNAFGWDVVPLSADGMDEVDGGFGYSTNGGGEEATAGICDAKFLGEQPGYWRIYLGVEDCDAAVEKIKELGGSLIDGPDDSPFGRFATVADPQGGQFQINQSPTA